MIVESRTGYAGYFLLDKRLKKSSQNSQRFRVTGPGTHPGIGIAFSQRRSLMGVTLLKSNLAACVECLKH